METTNTLINKVHESLKSNLAKVIIGKEKTLDLVICCLLSDGHLLIDDVPGVGKTTLAKGLAKSFAGSFNRLQFTPDMLPSDVTGVSIFNQQTRDFEFRPGPVMAQVVLADEINRATPKTQSALLEAMEERQITVDGVTHKLPYPFIVIGTQNPIEYEGTFPLPEAQLDRFFMRSEIGYPGYMDEIRILDSQKLNHPINDLAPVISAEQLHNAQNAVKEIFVSDAVKRYLVDIVRKTRDNEEIFLGSSPRGSLALFRAGQAMAAIRKRDYVIPDDIKYLAKYVLSHRIVLNPSGRIKNLTPDLIIEDIVASVAIPDSTLLTKE